MLSRSIQYITLLTTLTLTSLTVHASDDTLEIKTSGGSYADALEEAFFKPFAEKHDIEYTLGNNNEGLAIVQAEHEAQNGETDIIVLYENNAIRGCEEGILTDLPFDEREDYYVEGTVLECGVGFSQYATMIATDDETEIDSVEDFFDPSIPGRRGMTKWAEHTLELALLGAGVEPEDVPEKLKTQEGVELAFETLDKIKDDIVWFHTGAQANQMLIDDEVVATVGYDARFNKLKDEGYDVELLWDGFVTGTSMAVVPETAPNKEKAIELLDFASSHPRNSQIAKHIAYSPVTKEFDDDLIDERFATHPSNKDGAVRPDLHFWADNTERLNEQFSNWLNK